MQPGSAGVEGPTWMLGAYQPPTLTPVGPEDSCGLRCVGRCQVRTPARSNVPSNKRAGAGWSVLLDVVLDGAVLYFFGLPEAVIVERTCLERCPVAKGCNGSRSRASAGMKATRN
jgi:hypothetical protein